MFRSIYLVADIGATNSRFAIIDRKQRILLKKTYLTTQHTFNEMLKLFLSETQVQKSKISDVCIAIAGPINNERIEAQLTNTQISINTNALKEQFKFRKILLLNDLEAAGFGLGEIRQDQYIELSGLSRNRTRSIAVISPGTGLGACIVRNDTMIPYASEAGHIDFAVQADDRLESGFYKFLKRKNKSLEYESIVSGNGIILIYEYLKTQKHRHNPKVSSIIKKATPLEQPKLITKYALEDRDQLCLKTVELFIRFYARAARSLALTSLCSELFLAGRISIILLPVLKDIFIEDFTSHDHKNIRAILEDISVAVIIDQDIVLLGAARALGMRLT
jgi:glucokinase